MLDIHQNNTGRSYRRLKLNGARLRATIKAWRLQLDMQTVPLGQGQCR